MSFNLIFVFISIFLFLFFSLERDRRRRAEVVSIILYDIRNWFRARKKKFLSLFINYFIRVGGGAMICECLDEFSSGEHSSDESPLSINIQ